MMKVSSKRILSIALTGMLCLSTSGCGKTETIVEDYGSSNEKISSTDTSTGTDSVSVAVGDEGTLREIFGSKIEYQEDFTIGKTDFKCNAVYEVPGQDHLNVYNMKQVDDGKKDEAAIVKALFGDTAEKLKTIQYVNQYDYMPLLYKYRKIIADHMYFRGFHFGEDTSDIPDTRAIITASNVEVYGWKDDEDLYIHMYEGEYDGTSFTLLLGYDYVENLRYIFLEPKNIKEYYPDYDFKTLVVAGENDSLGQPQDLDNMCSDSVDNIIENAESFVNSELKLGTKYHIIEDPMAYKNYYSDHLVDMASYINMVSSYDDIDIGPSILMFSNTDYMSSFMTGVHGMTVDYSVIAEQRDLIAEHRASHIGSTISEYEFIFSESAGELMDKTTFTVDGYAVYLTGDEQPDSDEENADYIGLTTLNAGIIKYTSKGLYGVDIVLTDEITDYVEDVRLLEFDKIKEGLKVALEDLDFERLGNPKELSINVVELYYAEYHENEDSDTYSSIPAWGFTIEGVGNSNTGPLNVLVSINAMDGSLINIEYYDFY